MPLPPDLAKNIQNFLSTQEKQILSPLACKSSLGIRKIPESSTFRPVFVRDGDRIIHSLSYARYFDKTQVFFWIKSDLHQHRMLHVQLVAKLGRVVANVLGLNQDLVESIALGHDIGHPPFGHDGERILSDLCQSKGIGYYHHNYGSTWFLQDIELQNLTLPVLDGILCHNGENHKQKIALEDSLPLTWDQWYKEREELRMENIREIQPKTLEGILVRYIDVVSYISRDILDAEHLGIIKFSDLPENVKKVLGTTNREIIDSLITDIISESYQQPFIGYSDDVFDALKELYKFNLDHIYLHEKKNAVLPLIKRAFHTLWDKYYQDLIEENRDSNIYTDHIDFNLKMIQDRYPEIDSYQNYTYMQNQPEIIVRDFIAGMTDQYFWQLTKQIDPSIDYTPATIY
ncbi:MAG: deoxyguanosinetriphosphate triphosphohydrolase family protein [Promethearchaeota archaeon]